MRSLFVGLAGLVFAASASAQESLTSFLDRTNQNPNRSIQLGNDTRGTFDISKPPLLQNNHRITHIPHSPEPTSSESKAGVEKWSKAREVQIDQARERKRRELLDRQMVSASSTKSSNKKPLENSPFDAGVRKVVVLSKPEIEKRVAEAGAAAGRKWDKDHPQAAPLKSPRSALSGVARPVPEF